MKKIASLFAPALLFASLSNAQLAPSGPLQISTNVTWTSNHWAKALKMGNGSAIQFSADGHYFGIGATSPNGLYFFSTPADSLEAAASYRMAIKENGNVGIGTIYPDAMLDVYGTFKLGVTGYTGGEAYCIGFTRESNAHLFSTNAQGLLLGGDATGYDMNIRPNGNIGIGTSNPKEKLSVKGTVLAEKMRVSINASDWPDYVFRPGYPLLSLNEIEAFVSRHHRLPDVPSAEAVEKDGLDLGEMNKQLLKKVEELTLHLIEMGKQQKQMQMEIGKLNEIVKNHAR